MVKKTKKTKTSPSAALRTRAQKTDIIPGGKLNNFLNSYSEKFLIFRKSKSFYIILVILGILLLSIYKKSWFVAALVNGIPLTNIELQSELNRQYRTQTLNQLINEKIILDEARKGAAIPTETEIDNKIAELEKNVGGKDTLDNLLTQQGQTREGLRDQIKVQLAITKLYSNEATVSAEEVAKFLEENKEALVASDSAGQEKEAYEALKNQKLSQIFSQKFQELRNRAKIQIF